MRIGTYLILLLLGSAAHAESVVIHTWQTAGSQTQQKMYAGDSGMVIEDLEARGSGGSPEWLLEGDLVVLADRIVMNDDGEQASMEMNPATMPQIPAFGLPGGAAGGPDLGGLAEALAQAEQALQDAPPEARQALQGLLGGGGLQGLAGGGGGPATPEPASGVQLSATGNTGTSNGMDWQEIELRDGVERTVYRLADWDAVPGAEVFVGHYRNMMALFTQISEAAGFGQSLQGLDAWSEQFLDYLVANEKFPVYMDDGSEVTELVATANGTIDDGRFGPRYAVQNPF